MTDARHVASSDGWSTGILYEELGAFYSAALENSAVELPPLPVQYADFSAWQARYRPDLCELLGFTFR